MSTQSEIRDSEIGCVGCACVCEGERGGEIERETRRARFGGRVAVETEGEKVEAVTDFIFLGSKITENGDCNHEIIRHLLLGRKTMTNLDSTLKSRDITLPTKVDKKL